MTANNIQFTKVEIQIAKYLFKHYKNKYNARQLAKLLNINHAHANKLCRGLVEKQLLIKEEIGNSKYFSYGYGDGLALKFMEYILSQEKKDIPKWIDILLYNLEKFNPFIEMSLVFGSSINKKDFNDIDILLIHKKGKSNEIKEIKDEIRKSQLLEKPIRYVDITEKDIYLNKEDKVFYNIISDNLIFYNPEKYVEIVNNAKNK